MIWSWWDMKIKMSMLEENDRLVFVFDRVEPYKKLCFSVSACY